jgi:hypothetical protein
MELLGLETETGRRSGAPQCAGRTRWRMDGLCDRLRNSELLCCGLQAESVRA